MGKPVEWEIYGDDLALLRNQNSLRDFLKKIPTKNAQWVGVGGGGFLSA